MALSISLTAWSAILQSVTGPASATTTSNTPGQIAYFYNSTGIIAVDPTTGQQVGSFNFSSANYKNLVVARSAPVLLYQSASSAGLYMAEISPTGLANVTYIPSPTQSGSSYIAAINNLGTEALIQSAPIGSSPNETIDYFVVSLSNGQVTSSYSETLPNGSRGPYIEFTAFSNDGHSLLGSLIQSSTAAYIYQWNLLTNSIGPLQNGGVYARPNQSLGTFGQYYGPNFVADVAPNSSDLFVGTSTSKGVMLAILNSSASSTVFVGNQLSGAYFSPDGTKLIKIKITPSQGSYTTSFVVTDLLDNTLETLTAASGMNYTLIGWTATLGYGAPSGNAFGSCVTKFSNGSVVGGTNTTTGNGYYEVDPNGNVAAFGDATCYGSLAGTALNSPIVGMALAPGGDGYWLVASDGSIYAFGNAQF